MSTTTMKKTATLRKLLLGVVASLGLVTLTETAQAQEILLTGPLAGARAVRQLRLYRQNRLQVTPAVTFPILNEFQQPIFAGLELQYNITDWLGIGVWGAYAPIQLELGLTEHVQEVNRSRRCQDAAQAVTTPCRLTAINLGGNFADQLGQMDWVASPQLTGVPFRGKLALFRSIYVDTEIFFYAGAAFVGLQERAVCEERGTCARVGNRSFERESRVAIGPTGGLGLTFWAGKWHGLMLQYRLMPFAWNTGGFDVAGGGPNDEFPDGLVNKKDREYKFNQLLTVGWSFYFPTQNRVSE